MTEFPLIKKTLPSGLRVVLLPRDDRQTVTFLVLIGVGSRYETPKQAGLSHFLEHMFFKGTATRPTAKEIAEAIDSVGGEFNAFTGEEYTGYYVTVAAEYLDRGAEVVSDILLRPLFQTEEINREKGVIIEEIRMYTGMPMRHVQHLWQNALFGTHPLGRRIDGSEKTVASFQQRDFKKYVAQHYHAKNAVVTVAGRFDENKITALLTQLFKSLTPGDESHPKPAPRRMPAQRFVSEYRRGLEQTHLIVGVPGISLHDERRWAVGVLATLLGGGMSSRLFLSIRERHGLAYAVKTSTDQYADAGGLSTQAGVRSDSALKALELILAEYDRVMTEPVEDVELKKAKHMLHGHLMLELEETNSLAVFAGSQELLLKHMLTPAQIKAKIEAVSVSDVQAVAQELLDRRYRAVALLSPHRHTDAYERAAH